MQGTPEIHYLERPGIDWYGDSDLIKKHNTKNFLITLYFF